MTSFGGVTFATGERGVETRASGRERFFGGRFLRAGGGGLGLQLRVRIGEKGGELGRSAREVRLLGGEIDDRLARGVGNGEAGSGTPERFAHARRVLEIRCELVPFGERFFEAATRVVFDALLERRVDPCLALGEGAFEFFLPLGGVERLLGGRTVGGSDEIQKRARVIELGRGARGRGFGGEARGGSAGGGCAKRLERVAELLAFHDRGNEGVPFLESFFGAGRVEMRFAARERGVECEPARLQSLRGLGGGDAGGFGLCGHAFGGIIERRRERSGERQLRVARQRGFSSRAAGGFEARQTGLDLGKTFLDFLRAFELGGHRTPHFQCFGRLSGFVQLAALLDRECDARLAVVRLVVRGGGPGFEIREFGSQLGIDRGDRGGELGGRTKLGGLPARRSFRGRA